MPLLTVTNLTTSPLTLQDPTGLSGVSITVPGSGAVTAKAVTEAALAALEPQLVAEAAANNITWAISDDPASKADSAFGASLPGTPTFTLGAEIGDARIVTIQLKDLNGANLAAKAKATVWVSDTAGGAPSAAAPDGGSAISAGTLLKEHTAEVLLDAISTAAGVIGLTITESTAKSFFVNVAVGNVVVSSAAVAFA